MNKQVLRADLLLLVTAAVWGFGFVAQRSGMQHVGPFTFNGIRFLLGSIALLPFIAWRRKREEKVTGVSQGEEAYSGKKNLLLSSFLAGSCLFVAASFQQLGMMATSAGNGGFITGLYVIFTPIFGIFLKKKTGKATWVGAIITFAGLYFLSSRGSLKSINPGDVLVAVSAIFWAFHVLIIDRLVQKTDPVELSSGQFAITGLHALAAAFLIEPLLGQWLETMGPKLLSDGLFAWKSFPVLISGLSSGAIPTSIISAAIIPILYAGLGSAGIGYTLQVVAQRHAPPAHTTIILCLEGCFAALGGFLLLQEAMTSRTFTGFALMLAGMLISQWELIREQKKN